MKKFLSLVLALLLTLGASLPAMAEISENYLVNDALVTWCNAYNNLLYIFSSSEEEEVIDTVFANGRINLLGNEVAYGPTGVPVYHGGAYSNNGTVMMGMGSGTEGYEDHWYVSLSFSAEASADTIYWTALSFILACKAVGFEFPEDTAEMLQIADELLMVLLSSESIAVEVNGLVFVGKQLPGGMMLLAVDTVPYYDEFYYNDTDNYLVLE